MSISTVSDTGLGRTDLGGLRIAIANWRDPWHPQAGGAERYAWEMARALTRARAQVTFLTARASGQASREERDGITIVRRGGQFGVYPRILLWLLTHRRSFDAVLDCQNGIPFFTPLALRRKVPVLCVMHHVHTAQFGVHFGRAMAWAGPSCSRGRSRGGCTGGMPAWRSRRPPWPPCASGWPGPATST